MTQLAFPFPDEITDCGGFDTNLPDNWIGECCLCGGADETNVRCNVCDSEVCCECYLEHRGTHKPEPKRRNKTSTRKAK